MCRNIKTLYNFEPPATAAEIEASALQFVRKVSGFRKPSLANQAVFDKAVTAISSEVTRLLEQLQTHATPKNRELEARKRKVASQARFASVASHD